MTTPGKAPHGTFNNGHIIPMIGLGTWHSLPLRVHQAVKDAIDVGYRHIDCAYAYLNEHEIGDAIASKIEEGVIRREDIFITSKLWNTFHRPELVESACRASLRNLHIGCLDLYLIHWPMGYQEGNGLFPMSPDGKTYAFSEVDYVDTWKAMEHLVDLGLVKSIGVSNFNTKQLQRILDVARTKPVVNQVENHPYLHQFKLAAFCKENGIIVTAYSPLGSPSRPWAKEDDVILLHDEKLRVIAEKHGKQPAQILIRYQIEQGHVSTPKSVNKKRIAANIDVFDFELDEDDMRLLVSMERNERFHPEPLACGHLHHPWKEEN